jgi:hypothetical protein
MSYRTWAYVALGIGLSASITANVASTVLKETTVPLALRVPFAVIWPVLTYLAIEILSRTPWRAGWKHWMVRAVLVAPVGLVAAFVSYLHQHDLMRLGGEPGLAQGFGPLAVDGLLFGAAFVLISTKESASVDEVLEKWVPEIPESLQEWATEISAPVSPAPVSPAPLSAAVQQEMIAAHSAETEKAIDRETKRTSLRSPRISWDVSRVAEMAISGEPFSVAKETGIGQSTYSNVVRVAKILRESPRADLSTAGKLPSGEVISAMRQRLVKA